MLAEVRTIDTRRGSIRYVAKDADGREYTPFREAIGEQARQLQGRRVRLEYHEDQRGQYTNVYLDKVEPTEPATPRQADTNPQEAAWRTAVEAAPWLVGESAPNATVISEQLYEKLKPLEERVATDIQEQQDGRPDDREGC